MQSSITKCIKKTNTKLHPCSPAAVRLMKNRGENNYAIAINKSPSYVLKNHRIHNNNRTFTLRRSRTVSAVERARAPKKPSRSVHGGLVRFYFDLCKRLNACVRLPLHTICRTCLATSRSGYVRFAAKLDLLRVPLSRHSA